MTLPTGDTDHRAVPTTLDCGPFDDRGVTVVVGRYDENTPDGPLSSATGVELRITTDDLAEDGSPVVVDVFLAPAVAQALGIVLGGAIAPALPVAALRRICQLWVWTR